MVPLSSLTIDQGSGFFTKLKKLILAIVGVAGLTAASWGQTVPPSVTLSNLGDLSTTYTILGSPTTVGEDTIYSYYDTEGPQSPYGFGAQKSLSIAVAPDGTMRLSGVTDWLAPWIINARILFDEDGNVRSTTGYATSIDTSGFSVNWDGGGFGPGYVPPGGGGFEGGTTDAEILNRGLLFQDGSWIPE